MIKKKSQAIRVYGTASALADVLGIAKSSLHEWPEVLSTRQRREIMGALIEDGKARFVPTKATREAVGE